MPPGPRVLFPDLVLIGGRFVSGTAVSIADGRIAAVGPPPVNAALTRLGGQALLPGLINAHSHAFQRALRGRTQLPAGPGRDDFWTWRDRMYDLAARLDPDGVYVASRMAFLEMALSGITAVGEFHYLHHAPDGTPYAEPTALARQVVRAAREVGLRICLLRAVYARGGPGGAAVDPRQKRFLDPRPTDAVAATEAIASAHRGDDRVSVGLAPHSVRAVPLAWLLELAPEAEKRRWPVQMHVAEQSAEVEACQRETGHRPIEAIASTGSLTERFTAVHAIHLSIDEIGQLAAARATVCACPTTERDLGDGVVPAAGLLGMGAQISLGTDSHAAIDLLEDARELELNLRLVHRGRNLLAAKAREVPEATAPSALAATLWTCATAWGARSLGLRSGTIAPGAAADLFSVDLSDPSIAGATADDLLAAIVFALSKSAVRSVWVAGETVVENGRHLRQADIVESFARLTRSLWA